MPISCLLSLPSLLYLPRLLSLPYMTPKPTYSLLCLPIYIHHIAMLTPCLFTLRFLCLINTLYSRLYQLVKKVYKLKKHAVTKSPTRYQLVKKFRNEKTCSHQIPDHQPKVSKSSALPTVHLIAVVNGCLDQHRCLSATRVEKLRLLETFKNKLHHARRHSYHVEQV